MTTRLEAEGPPTPESQARSARPDLFAWYAQGFSDQLGDRLLLFDNTQQGALELLRLNSKFFDGPPFELALRNETRDLASFDNPSFARVWRVERLPEPGGGLAVVSTHAPGVRLSEVLANAARRRVTLDTAASLLIIKQLVTAVAMLQQRGRHVCHGAISLERLVIASEGRVIVPEYVLAPALATLAWNGERFWKELRLAVLDGTGSSRFEQRTDVLQIGVVALALILNRPLKADEYPRLLPELVERAASATYGDATLKRGLESWLLKALQLDLQPFTTAIQAWTALDEILARSRLPVSAQMSLRTFVTLAGTPSSLPSPAVAGPQALEPAAHTKPKASHALSRFATRQLPAAVRPDVLAVQREIRFWKATVIVLAAISLGEAWFIGAQLGTPAPPPVEVVMSADSAALPAAAGPPASASPQPAGFIEDSPGSGDAVPPVTPAPRPTRRPGGRAAAAPVATLGFERQPRAVQPGQTPTGGPPPGAGSSLAAVSPPAAAEPSIAEKMDIRRALSRYESAFNASDGAGMREVWPSADLALLPGAGSDGPQQITLGTCVYESGADSVTARCRGSAAIASLASGIVRTEYRTFTFKLKKVGESWAIDAAEAER